MERRRQREKGKKKAEGRERERLHAHILFQERKRCLGSESNKNLKRKVVETRTNIMAALWLLPKPVP